LGGVVGGGGGGGGALTFGTKPRPRPQGWQGHLLNFPLKLARWVGGTFLWLVSGPPSRP